MSGAKSASSQASAVGANSTSSQASAVDAKFALSQASAVCFDVDSTVIQEEGINVLAEFLGAGEGVAALTSAAMEGSVLFEDALKSRLDLIKPSKSSIDECLKKRTIAFTSGVEKVVELLHERGTHVYLISGGFRQMIDPIATTLGIPLERVYANNILFDTHGEYESFDAQEPTSRDGGKAAVIQLLKDKHGYDKVVMFGDGATDMQARPPAEAFIGYGGVVVRDAVKIGADWFIMDFSEIISELES